MGNSQSGEILLKLDRINLIYLTNEIIRGNVLLTINEGQLKIDEISICLTGEIGYTKTKLTVDGTGQSITTTDYKQIEFYSQKIPFLQRKTGENKLILSKGEYSWPFEITLVNSLPPTLNQYHSYPYVSYRLRITMNQSWYEPNRSQTTFVTIYPFVDLQRNSLKTKFENESGKDIQLKCILDKLTYFPNEFIHMEMNLTNSKRLLIKQIDFYLYQFYQIQSNSKENLLFQTTLPNLFNEKDEQIHRTCSILIPSHVIPPTFRYQNERISVEINYYLRISVQLHRLFTHFDFDVPIRLVNKS